MILTFILDHQLENAKTGKSILANFTEVRHGYRQNLVYSKRAQSLHFKLFRASTKLPSN